MIDIKKLITGFLILSALASSSAFIFSDFAPSRATTENSAVVLNNQSDSAPQVPSNALVEPLPENPSAPLGASNAGIDLSGNISAGNTADDGLPPLVPTSNLTNNMTQMALREFIRANPRGPQEGAGGLGLVKPNADSLVGEIIKNSGMEKLAIPDWDAEIIAQKFSIVQNATPAEEAEYKAAMQDIYNENFVQNNLIALTQSNSPTAATAVGGLLLPFADKLSPAIDKMLQESTAVPVPERFALLHQSEIKLLVYAKNFFALAQNASDDPLKAYFILQAKGKDYRDALAKFSAELQKVAATSDAAPSKAKTIFLSLFGVQTAHAQYTDIFQAVYQPFVWIFNWLNDVLTQTMKNMIIKMFTDQVLNWVRGGGKPLFITNWKGTLENIFSIVASAKVKKKAAQLCGNFGALVNLNLQSSFSAPNYLTSVCTIDRLVGNVKNFYANFQNGGWLAYGAMVLPTSDYYGSLFWTAQGAEAEGDKAAGATKNEGIASKGFLGVKKCPAGTEESTVQGMCYDPDGDVDVPMITTPGGTVGDVVGQAMGATPQQIANADGFTGILASFISSLVNALISRGMTLL